MKLRAKTNLPAPIVAFLEQDLQRKHEKSGDFYVTELLAPPRQVQLREQHDDELESDASEHIWRLFGTGFHNAIETSIAAAGTSDQFAELHLHGDFGGYDVTCKVDFMEVAAGQVAIWDWKTTSVFSWKSFMGEEGKPEWEAQLNLMAEICRQNDYNVTSASIGALLRDWRPGEAERQEGYPTTAWQDGQVRLWSHDECLDYGYQRITAHKNARESLPECTPEERWERPTTYRTLKPGGKRSTKNFTDKDQAEAFATEKGLVVDVVPGEWGRCGRYCDVRDVCLQYQQHTQE